MATVAEIHANSVIKKVQLKGLHIDPTYQRDISEKLVDDIAGNWNELAAELPTISDRGTRNGSEVRGGQFIVNGQHRAKAAQKLNMTELDARVIDLRKEADPGGFEANIRLMTNKKLSDRPLERFKAQVRGGNEESIDIEKILARFGTKINTVANPAEGVNCIATIEKIYRLEEKGGLLADTFKLAQDTWGSVDGPHAKSDPLKAMCWFIDKHSDESDRDRLVKNLKEIGQGALEQRARTHSLSLGGALWVNYYRATLDVYNKGLTDKNKLQPKLRGKSSLGSTTRVA